MTNTVLQQTIFRCFQMKFFQHIQNLFEHREPMYIVTGRNVQIQTKLYKHIWKKIILNCIPTTFIHYIKKFLKH